MRTWSVDLLPHGGTRPPALRGLTAHVQRPEPRCLHITYALDAELAQLRIPASQPPRAGANLWQHTCFELFITQSGMPGYHEFNFSPSGEWAVYAFSGYRRATRLADALEPPQIEVRTAERRLELQATVRLEPLLSVDVTLAAGITAVVEDAEGSLSYWALAHPAGKPDFHRAEGFILEIDAARN